MTFSVKAINPVRSCSKTVANSFKNSNQNKTNQYNFSSTPNESKINFSTGKSQEKFVVISGAGGNTANTPIFKFLEKNFKVIALTSQKNQVSKNPNLIYIQIDRAELSNCEYVKKMIKFAMKHFNANSCSHMVGLNLIGGAVAPKNSSLEVLNNTIPITFLKGVKAIGEESADKVSLIQISSIAAEINGDSACDYAKIKKKTDEEILGLSTKYGNVIVLRPGIIMPNPTEDGIINMGHAYSPEQFGNMRIIPIIGSGNQIQQPVAEDCLYDAAVFGVEKEGVVQIVVAVGKDVLTQKQMVSYFSSKGYAFVHIPVKFAKSIAEHFPMGRLAPYSVRMMETLENPEKNKPLCGKKFEELLGRPALGLKELYNTDKVVVASKAPIGTHLSSMVSETVKNPQKGFSVAMNFLASLPSIKFSGVEKSEKKS